MSEHAHNIEPQTTFSEVTSLVMGLDRLRREGRFGRNVMGEPESGLHWDIPIQDLSLHTDAALYLDEKFDLGPTVRARILGDDNNVVVILRSRNLWNTSRCGFLIRPAEDGGAEVMEGPADRPPRRGKFEARELMFWNQLEPSPKIVVESLIESLRQIA